jgi:DNA-binding Xre family transcriptional regulator
LLKSLKQKELSSYLGISENACSRIENGHTRLTIENLYRICEKLGVAISEVLDLSKKNIYNNHSTLLMSQNEGTFNITLTPKEFNEIYTLLEERKKQ